MWVLLGLGRIAGKKIPTLRSGSGSSGQTLGGEQVGGVKNPARWPGFNQDMFFNFSISSGNLRLPSPTLAKANDNFLLKSR